ncbi:hypothetical protein ACFL52_03600, partial [Candidatus Margulisiibacteriota bacterium]
MHVAQEAVNFNTFTNRPYSVWIYQNLIDFFIGNGIAQFMLFIGLLVFLIHKAVKSKSFEGDNGQLLTIAII